MKLHSYIALSFLVIAASACAKKSDSSSHDESAADAALSDDDPEACTEMAEALSLHGDIEGYTASANSKFHVKVDWASPLVAGEASNSATVTFLSHHGEPLALRLSSFQLFMTAMGHGSAKAD